jgi:hypothetical protein
VGALAGPHSRTLKPAKVIGESVSNMIFFPLSVIWGYCTGGSVEGASGRMNQKVEPAFGVLSTPIFP